MSPRLITIAVLALGGQGGGVLVDWIVDLAEHAGWTAQATSVAGVAQRTGATIYYIELVEPTPGQTPVLAQMPIPGEVDVLIAAELMEAGRAVERGLVTPNRTTLIASSHRTYAVQEKMVPGDGVADSGAVLRVLQHAAQRLITADLQALAVAHGSVISASLFGALAGSGALPFAAADFDAVVARSGVGVKASLAALHAAAELAQRQPNVAPPPADPMQTAPRALPQQAASAALQPLLARIRGDFPPAAWDWLGEGLARVVDWQDAAYGGEYLDQVAAFARADDAAHGHQLSIEAARWIAVAMAYDDVIRVADLKTRADRTARLRTEINAGQHDVVVVEEFFHPRIDEVLDLLPRRWAAWVARSPGVRAMLARHTDQGRRIHPHTVIGHLQLRLAASLRRWRRGSQRHAHETAHRAAWLQAAQDALATDYDLAVEILRCRRLIKGYSDTHARGSSRFDRLLQAAARLRGQPDAATSLALLREAALRDAEGQALAAQEQALGLALPPAAG